MVHVKCHIRKLSPYAKKLLKDRVGYRCESAYGSGERDAVDVLTHEYKELGNTDMVIESAKVLGVKPTLKAVITEIRRRFGENAVALWLGTKECIVKEYCSAVGCDPGIPPDKYTIPPNAILLVDLEDEGQFFVMSAEDYDVSERGEKFVS